MTMRTLKQILKNAKPRQESALNLKKWPLKAVLYRGGTTPLTPDQTLNKTWICENMGTLRGIIDGYACPRCQKNEGYLGIDGDGSIWFCAESDCLQDDSNASKSKDNETRVQKSLSAEAKKDLEMREKMIAAFGALYQNAALANLPLAPNQIADIKKWMDSGNGFFLFAGRPGCGKTYLCASVYYWILKSTTNIKHLPIRQYMFELKDAMKADNKEDSTAIIQKYQNVGCLIVDDLGATANSEWQREVIFDLLDYRYQHNKQTLITTNLNYDAMCKSLDERITSRVYDKRNLLLEDWKNDYRKKAQW